MATSKSKQAASIVPAKKTAKTAAKTPTKTVPVIIGKAKPIKPKKQMATTSQILDVGANLLG